MPTGTAGLSSSSSPAPAYGWHRSASKTRPKPSAPPQQPPPSTDIPNWSMLRRYPMSVRPSRSRTRCFSAAEGRGEGSATATRGHQHPPCRAVPPPIQRGEASNVRVTAPAAPRGARTLSAAAPRGTGAHGVGGSRSLGKSRESNLPSPGVTGRPTGDGTVGKGGPQLARSRRGPAPRSTHCRCPG